jgi:hypothetical protein
MLNPDKPVGAQRKSRLLSGNHKRSITKARKKAKKNFVFSPPPADVFVINKFFYKMQRIQSATLKADKNTLSSRNS